MSGYAAFAFLFGVSALAAPPALPGVGNFHQVDNHVYRGAQPTNDGFRNLAKLGVKIIVDLREPGDRSRSEEKLVIGDGMRYVPVPMNGMHAPSNKSIAQVLNLLENPSTGPVFVHCRRGADRTGSVIACYRIEYDHWQNDKALAEARSLGMSWMERAMHTTSLTTCPGRCKRGSVRRPAAQRRKHFLSTGINRVDAACECHALSGGLVSGSRSR